MLYEVITIMDIRMPELDGYGALERLKSSVVKEIPVLIATASVLSGDQQKIKDSQADGFVTKPIDVDLFFEQIAELLHIRNNFV